MRHLVYRVQALSQSLLPLVWDFGTLKQRVEQVYIEHMVLKYVSGFLETYRTLLSWYTACKLRFAVRYN